MRHDKKVVAGTLHFVLPTGIGATAIVDRLSTDRGADGSADGDRGPAERRAPYGYSSRCSFSFDSSIL